MAEAGRPSRRLSSADASESDLHRHPSAVRTAVARSTSIRFSAHDDDAYSSSEDEGRSAGGSAAPAAVDDGRTATRAGRPGGGQQGASAQVVTPGSDADASLCSVDSSVEGGKRRGGGRLRSSKTARSVCTVESFNDLDGLDDDDEGDGGSDDGGDSAAMGAAGSAGAGSSMTIETSNMARRELLDMMMDSEHGGSSVGSDPRRQRRGRQPLSSATSRWSASGAGLSGSFARRWGPDDGDEEAGRASKEGEPALDTAGEMRKRRRRGVARRTARAALGVLVAAALSVAAVLLLTGEGGGIREATRGVLDAVLGTMSGEGDGGARHAVAAATTAEEEGARRAVETGIWDGDRRPDLPDDRMMALKAGGDGREARAVSMLEAKLRRAGEDARAMTTAAAADIGDGRGMMMTTNAADPLAMAREAEGREERVVTLNGARVSLRDLVRYQAGPPDGGAAGLL